MKNFLWIVFTLSLSFSEDVAAQSKTSKSFFFNSGAGPAYSFFEVATPPFPTFEIKDYNIDKVLGRAFEFEIGYQMKKGYSISVQYSDLKFAKKFKIYDTIQNTNYNYSLDGKLYRNQYYWQVLLSKQIKSTRKSLLGASTGIMFINDGEQFSIQYAGVRNISNPSASFYEFRSWEFGVPAAIFYERKLSTNISLGVKAQAYIIISVGSFEAVSLNPYISARF